MYIIQFGVLIQRVFVWWTGAIVDICRVIRVSNISHSVDIQWRLSYLPFHHQWNLCCLSYRIVVITALTPVRWQYSYCSLALSHRYVLSTHFRENCNDHLVFVSFSRASADITNIVGWQLVQTTNSISHVEDSIMSRLYSSRNLKFFNIASVFLANISSCRTSTDNVITRISADLTLTNITYSNSLTYMARPTKIHFWNEIPSHIVKHTLIYWNISFVIILSSSTVVDFQWIFHVNKLWQPILLTSHILLRIKIILFGTLWCGCTYFMPSDFYLRLI